MREPRRQAIHYLDASETTPRVITIYAWNEWTEGGYLEPEQRTGMSYLEALQRVLSPTTFPPPDLRGLVMTVGRPSPGHRRRWKLVSTAPMTESLGLTRSLRIRTVSCTRSEDRVDRPASRASLFPCARGTALRRPEKTRRIPVLRTIAGGENGLNSRGFLPTVASGAALRDCNNTV